MLHTLDHCCCDVLDYVGLHLKTVKFFVQPFGCCMMLCSFGHVHLFTQHCWTRACALGSFVACQGSGHINIQKLRWKCCVRLASPFNTCRNIIQHYCNVLCANDASVWPLENNLVLSYEQQVRFPAPLYRWFEVAYSLQSSEFFSLFKIDPLIKP